MMADLVHQYVGDDGGEAFLVLRPLGKDRPAVEPDHVRHHAGDLLAEGQTDALEEAEQIVTAGHPHMVEHFARREIVDPDDQIPAEFPEMRRQAGESPRC